MKTHNRETDSIPGSEDHIAKQGLAKSRPDSICECGHSKEVHFQETYGCTSYEYCKCQKYNPSPRATSRGSHEVVEDVSTHDRGSDPSVDTNDFSERIEKIIVDAVMIRGSQSTKYAYAIQRGMKEALEAVEKKLKQSGNISVTLEQIQKWLGELR